MRQTCMEGHCFAEGFCSVCGVCEACQGKGYTGYETIEYPASLCEQGFDPGTGLSTVSYQYPIQCAPDAKGRGRHV